jgi:drug/metabolite transporter (DMT)-like permease
MSLMSLSAAAILLYTAPSFVIIISVFVFGEKLTVRKMALRLSCPSAAAVWCADWAAAARI